MNRKPITRERTNRRVRRRRGGGRVRTKRPKS